MFLALFRTDKCKKNMKKFVIFNAFLVFGGIAALADDFNVKGRLVGAEGEPLPYVNVLVVNSADSSYVKGAITGEDGTFSIDLQAGEYLMKFTYLGYKDVYENIERNTNVNIGTITMQEDAQVLNEIVIKGYRPTVKRNATGFVVSVENSPNLQGKTLDRILNVSPGVYIDRAGSISINGRSGVTVVINDKTMHLTNDQLLSYLNSIQGSDLKNIEIKVNPTSAYEAEGAGGVIHINTKRKTQQGLSGFAQAALRIHANLFTMSRLALITLSATLRYMAAIHLRTAC